MKKAINIFIVMALIIMSIAPCCTVSAAQSGTATKTNAEKIDSLGIIPEGFAFSEGECFKNRYGVSCFNGVWKNKDGVCLYIDSADGFIIDCFIGSYKKNECCENGISYDPGSSKAYLSKMKKGKYSLGSIRTIAWKTFKKAYPKLVGKYKDTYFTDGRFVYFSFTRVVNGISLSEPSADMIVDRITGTVVSFGLSTDFVNAPDSSFPTANDIIPPAEAGKAYIYEIGGMPVIISYRYDEKNGTAAPFYYSEGYRETAVNAETGAEIFPYSRSFYYQTIPYTDEDGDDDIEGSYDWEYDHEYDESFRFYSLNNFPTEGSQIDNEKEYISFESLLKKIYANKITGMPEDISLKVRRYAAGTIPYEFGSEREVVYYSFSDGKENGYRLDVCADAYSGDVITFSRSFPGSPARFEFDAEKEARKLLKRFFGSREKDYRLTSNKNGVLEFVRYINDIPFYDDTVHIVLDSDGKAAKFDFNTALPRKGIKIKTGKIVSQEKAVKDFYELYPPELVYTAGIDENGKPVIGLCYLFYDNDKFIINAFTGKPAEENDSENNEQ